MVLILNLFIWNQLEICNIIAEGFNDLTLNVLSMHFLPGSICTPEGASIWTF